MAKYITGSAVEEMCKELDRPEAHRKEELKDPKRRPLGRIRIDLVEECRHRLAFIASQAFRGV